MASFNELHEAYERKVKQLINEQEKVKALEVVLTTALRHAEEAEAIANQAMAEGLRAANLAKRLHVYDADGKVLTQAAVNRVLHERATHAGIIALLRAIVDEAIELQPVCTSPIDLLTMLEHEVHEQRIRRHRTERERDEAEAIANLAMSEGLYTLEEERANAVLLDLDIMGGFQSVWPSPIDSHQSGSWHMLRVAIERGKHAVVYLSDRREIKITVEPRAGGADA